MTDLIERLEALAGKVTPGDWTLGRVIGGYVDIDGLDAPISWQAFARFVVKAEAVNGFERSSEGEANAELICLLRNCLPTIIAALKLAELVRDEDWLVDQIRDYFPAEELAVGEHIAAAREIIAAMGEEVK